MTGEFATSSPTHTIESPGSTRRLDRFDIAVLAVFAAFSAWVVAVDLAHAIAGGYVWEGADGLWGDQFQYLAWIREASRHVLVSNLFVLQSTPTVYFQPAIVVSGVLAALGLPLSLSLLIWKPVSVIALFFVVRAFFNRTLAGRWAPRAGLVLALFFGSFTVVYGAVGAIGDLFPGFLEWGYPFAVLGLAAMVGALLSYDRARSRQTLAWAPGLLGAAASLLHPWNGALLIAAVLGAELVFARRGVRTIGRLAQPALTTVLTAAPLAYYVLLGHFDLSWRLARVASKHAYPLSAIVLELVPLLLPALLAYRRAPRTFLEAASMTWPIAALALFAFSMTGFAATPVHAFQGITIPLSLLAIAGLRSVGFRRLPYPVLCGSLLVAAFTIPTTVWQMNLARRLATLEPWNSNFITKDEHRALRYLDHDAPPGGVITRQYLGVLVPAETGRHTYVGDCLWSQPRCPHRLDTVRKLFAGQLQPAAARRLIQSEHASFVLADCRQSVPLDRLLPRLITVVHHFGCATVYEVG